MKTKKPKLQDGQDETFELEAETPNPTETRNTFNILFYLRYAKKAVEKNRKAPVYVRITVCEDKIAFATQIKVTPAQWIQKEQRVNGRGTDAKSANITLASLYDKISSAYNEALRREIQVTASDLKETVCPTSKNRETILSFFQQHNELYSQKIKIGKKRQTTLERYELVKTRLAQFIRNKYHTEDLSIHKITSIVIEEFEIFIRENFKSGNNNAMKHIQKLRTVILFAHKKGCKFLDPFLEYDLHWEKTERDFLYLEEVTQILLHPFKIERLEQVRNVFLFACFTGLSYCDLEKFNKDELSHRCEHMWITTTRNKTEIGVSLPLLSIPGEILKLYENKLENGKLLPVISNQKMNAYLKEIADICGIQKKLTCHTARHTFATLALTMDVPIETVSKMLGHSNITTTQIYAKIIDKKIKNDMEKFSRELEKIQKLIHPSKLLKAV